MGVTLRTQNFKILSTPLSFKNKIAEQKCNQICSIYGEICLTKMTKIMILPYFPYKNLGDVKIGSFVQEISS
jgi:hypothetical protein